MSRTNHRTSRLTRQMLEDELDRARIHRVNVTEDVLTLYLEDGRVLGMPTVWSPRLSKASEAERQNYEIIGHRAGLHWPDLDEYVSVRLTLLGRQSAVLCVLLSRTRSTFSWEVSYTSQRSGSRKDGWR